MKFYNYIFLISTLASLCNYHIHAAHYTLKKINEKSDQQLFHWFSATKNNNLKLIEDLINKVNINALNPDTEWLGIQDSPLKGATALILAAVHGHENLVKRLLEVPGINVNIQEKFGKTALIRAASRGYENIVKLLLNTSEIDVNIKDADGVNALMCAIAVEHENIVRLLLQNPKININSKDNNGWTALMAAADLGYANITKLLLDMPGIDINAQDNDGKTARVHAEEAEHAEIMKLIDDCIINLHNKAFNAITLNNVETLKSVIAQLGTDILDINGNTLIDKAFAANQPDIILFLLRNSPDPRELLSRIPFEAVQPSSEIFKFCMELAYNSEPISTPEILSKKDIKSCTYCSKQPCDKLCSKCKRVYYCSVECQKTDWINHKHSCNT